MTFHISLYLNPFDWTTHVYIPGGEFAIKSCQVGKDTVKIVCTDLIGCLNAEEPKKMWYSNTLYVSDRTALMSYVRTSGLNDPCGFIIGNNNEYAPITGLMTGSFREQTRKLINFFGWIYYPPTMWNANFVKISKQTISGSPTVNDLSQMRLIQYLVGLGSYDPVIPEICYDLSWGAAEKRFTNVGQKFEVPIDEEDLTNVYEASVTGGVGAAVSNTYRNWLQMDDVTVWPGRVTTDPTTQQKSFTPNPDPETATSTPLTTQVFFNQLFNLHATADFSIVRNVFSDLYGANGHYGPAWQDYYVFQEFDGLQDGERLWVFPTTWDLDCMNGMRLRIDGPAVKLTGDIPNWHDPRQDPRQDPPTP